MGDYMVRASYPMHARRTRGFYAECTVTQGAHVVSLAHLGPRRQALGGTRLVRRRVALQLALRSHSGMHPGTSPPLTMLLGVPCSGP